METIENTQVTVETTGETAQTRRISTRNIAIIGAILTICALYLGYAQYKVYLAKKQALFIQELRESAPKFTKKIPTQTYTNTLPPMLPKELFLGKLSELGQSYQLDYTKQKQSTVVFVSKNTARKNYELYDALLKKESWTIVNHLERDTLFSLYAKKENASLNITMHQSSPTATTSQVSVTYLE